MPASSAPSSIGSGGGITSFPGSSQGDTYGFGQGGSSGLGYNPQIPDPITTQTQALQGDIGNLGLIYQLADTINHEQNFQALQGLEQNLPGFTAAQGQETANTQSLLGGNLPPDVIRQMQQQAAERGIMTGSPDSPNAGAAYLAAIGQTSLGLQQLGMQNLSTEISQTPRVAPMDISPFLVTPAQEQAAGAENALLAAAPNPTAVARAGLGAANAGLAAGRAAGGGGAGGIPPGLAQLLGGGGVGAAGAGAGGVSGPNWGGTSSSPTADAYANWNKWYQSVNWPQQGQGGPGSAIPQGASFDPYTGAYTDPNSGMSYDPTTGQQIPANTVYNTMNDTASWSPTGATFYGGQDPTSYADTPASTGYNPVTDQMFAPTATGSSIWDTPAPVDTGGGFQAGDFEAMYGDF